LSHTIIPFEGTCWVTSEELGIARRCNGFARLVLADGRPLRDNGGRVLLRTHLMTFDALPLRYLDWLSGQDWLYGEFRERLTRYLKNPAIQRELEDLFPDPDDDSRRPLFMSSLPIGDRHATFCTVNCHRWHRWHGQPLLAGQGRIVGRDLAGDPVYDADITDWTPPKTQRICISYQPNGSVTFQGRTGKPVTATKYTQHRSTTATARFWGVLADAMTLFEHGRGEYEELNLLDIDALREACKVVPRSVADRVRAAFSEWHTRMRELQHETDPAVIERAELLAEALRYGPVLFAGPEKHVRGIKIVGKRRQWASCGVGIRGLRTTSPRTQRRSCLA
jgi:hypothetical protein